MKQTATNKAGTWGMSQALHLPTGKTYREFMFNDTAYWMLDHVRNAQNRKVN